MIGPPGSWLALGSPGDGSVERLQKEIPEDFAEPILDWGLQHSMEDATLIQAVAKEVAKQMAEYTMQSEILNRSCLQCFADVASLQSQVHVLWQTGHKPGIVVAFEDSAAASQSGTEHCHSGEEEKADLSNKDDIDGFEAGNDEAVLSDVG